MLKKNILANYISQIYVALVGILVLPLYIKYMGAEAYGLVGFFIMLQAWFNLLDMGLTPTIARETARFNGGATDALHYRRLVRALEGIFFLIAMAGGGILFFLSNVIAHDWLKADQLPISEIQLALNIMAAVVPLRWMAGLYRGIISGSEKFVWLSTFNSLIASLRFVGILPILMYVDTSPSTFFIYQLIVTAFELLGLITKSYRILPKFPLSRKVPWAWAPLKPILKFSLTVAFTSSVWVLVTQTDKLVLSNILPLAEYGYFTLAVLVAGGIMIISGPVGAALMPRMANLEAQGKHAELIRVYRQSTQFVAVVAGATATTLALGAQVLLQAWTGDSILAKQAAPILSLYAWGNGVLTLAAFPYYLQYAKGDLRFHLIGNAIFVVVLIPAILIAANVYQGVGAGYAWLSINLISFFAWLPLVHHKFEPGLNVKWYFHDIIKIIVPILLMGLILYKSIEFSTDSWYNLSIICLIGFALLVTGCLGSSEIRLQIRAMLQNPKGYGID